VFASSDLQALAMIEALEALGRRVPDDLSVVGFDDVELARYAGLTTVAQPLQDSGTRGAQLLLSALEGEDVLQARQHLSLELVVRGTTAPPREGETGREERDLKTATDGMISQSSLT
jgi:DNA-binding LacI/PurR family transcriptional regulator